MNNPFDFLEFVRNKKKLDDGEIKNFSPFLIQKCFYFADGNEKIVNILNYFWKLPKDMQYKLFCYLLNGERYNNWIGKKKNKDNDKDIVIDYLKRKFKCSTKTAKEYYILLDNSIIQQILKNNK